MASASTVPSMFSVYDNTFYKILGSAPRLELIHENQSYPFAHEASVYIPSSETLFMSSNIFRDPVTGEETIKITKASVSENPVTAEIIDTTVPMANGGVNHGAGILWTGQGTMNSTSGLFQMSTESPYKAELVVGGFYGREFNSPNDVVVNSDGSYWFTDPVYAWRQGLRPKPTLPNQVYRYDPVSKNVRVIADGFGRPNGITFSPDENTVYITDTAENNGDGSTDKLLAATM
jgi:gluconolactonase